MTQHRFSRRTVLALAAASIPLARATSMIDPTDRKLADLEKKSGGRLGIAILDTATGRRIGHRMDERFAMCSTFKLSLAAAILRQADRGKLSLDKFVPYTKADMIPHAPVTEANLSKGGMTIRDLVEAAQTQSDNPAANLLLKQIGGPAGLTQFFRDLGDQTSHLDRYEPDLNDVNLGEQPDTTTPAATVGTVARFLTGDVLTAASRDRLIQWMIATTTGSKRIRAGLPANWRAGDKTGTGLKGTAGKFNDIAIAWPPGKPPLIVAAYFNTDNATDATNDNDQAVLAEVGRIAAAWVG